MVTNNKITNEFVNERSYIYKLISKSVWAEKSGFFLKPTGEKQLKVVFDPEVQTPRSWDGVLRVLVQILHTRGVQQHTWGAPTALYSVLSPFSWSF